MKIVVNRLIKTDLSVISTVEINNMLKYYGMEPANPIPAGTYVVKKYNSPAHGYAVPLVYNVPGHQGIEIHVGNYPKDTKNCLLLGAGYVARDFIASSKIAIDEFYKKFFACIDKNEAVYITYKDLYVKS